jgi:hypothetical protein
MATKGHLHLFRRQPPGSGGQGLQKEGNSATCPKPGSVPKKIQKMMCRYLSRITKTEGMNTTTSHQLSFGWAPKRQERNRRHLPLLRSAASALRALITLSDTSLLITNLESRQPVAKPGSPSRAFAILWFNFLNLTRRPRLCGMAIPFL